MNKIDRDITMMTDLYQLTMMQAYFLGNEKNYKAIFDLFYRKNPDASAFSVAAGLEQVIDYVKNISFNDADIEYLASLDIFCEDFLNYLIDFRFTGDIYAVEEGTVVFPNEPLIRVVAPIMEAQFIETAVLNIINHQSLIATKAVRVNYAAQGDAVLEFGLRRAQGPDAAIYGARAAVIGGCTATSNVLAGQMFGVDIKGTHAHSYVMSFDSELEAFRAYAKVYKEGVILLVDTYDTLRLGVPNAIKVFEELRAKGELPKVYGIRLDSGDLSYLSKKSRKMLDEAGFKDAIISASSDLDEYLISELKLQGAKISLWGVGTNLITSKDTPAFGGVYKLSGIIKEGKCNPKIKLSDNMVKVSNPGYKKLLRMYDKATGKIRCDLICLHNESYDENEDLTVFDPISTWKKSTLKAGTYTIKDMLVPIFKAGKLVYKSPDTMQIRENCKRELDTLWDESRRLVNPQEVYVDLSQALYDLKYELINKNVVG